MQIKRMQMRESRNWLLFRIRSQVGGSCSCRVGISCVFLPPFLRIFKCNSLMADRNHVKSLSSEMDIIRTRAGGGRVAFVCSAATPTGRQLQLPSAVYPLQFTLPTVLLRRLKSIEIH